MKNKTKTGKQTPASQNINDNAVHGVSLAPSDKPELVRHGEANQSDKNPAYGDNFLWGVAMCVIATLMFCGKSRIFLDNHSGSISAIATVAIMFLTFSYVRYAGNQWRVMDRQLEQMKRQAALMDRQLEEMRTNNAVAISKERARIRIAVMNISLQDTGINGAFCYLANDGPTQGFVDESKGRFIRTESADVVPDYQRGAQIDTGQMIPGNGRMDNNTLILLEPTAVLSLDDILSIRKGESFIHFYGFVRYHDLFDRKWKRTIHLRWTMRWGVALSQQIMEWWDFAGSPEDNGETEEPQRQNPN